MLREDPIVCELERVIAEDQLVAFILGQGEVSPLTPYPEQDYNRWDQLERYYRMLDDDSKERQIIKETVLTLFDYPDGATKSASLTLSRLLCIKEIEAKISELIQQSKFDDLPLYVQTGLLLTATKLQLDRVVKFVVETMTQRGDLENFLLWSSTLPYVVYVDGYDLWRIEAIARYYETAGADVHRLVEQQLDPLAAQYPKIREIFRAFLETRGSEYKNFRVVIEKSLEAMKLK